MEEMILNEVIQKINFLIEKAVKHKQRKKRIFLQDALDKISKVKEMMLEE